jgi:hypothetical protein
MNSNANFKTLGLSTDASWDEVKSAFRRLARIYHPDIAGPDGVKKFAEITEAYMTLKETISPNSSTNAGSPPKAESVTAPASAGAAAKNGGKRESIFTIFWRMLFAKKDKKVHDEVSFKENLTPVRVRFLGGVISRAELEIQSLLSFRGEMKSRGRDDAILRRLKSRHQGVVLLALQSISRRTVTNEVMKAMLDHFAISVPTSEALDILLSLFSKSAYSVDLAKIFAAKAKGFSHSDAMMILRWLKRQNASKECFSAFLAHPSQPVVIATLNGWPSKQSLSDSAALMNLLENADESVLVPLLRLLKNEKIPARLVPAIKMMNEHKSPVVRVWASTIVRDQNLG